MRIRSAVGVASVVALLATGALSSSTWAGDGTIVARVELDATQAQPASPSAPPTGAATSEPVLAPQPAIPETEAGPIPGPAPAAVIVSDPVILDLRARLSKAPASLNKDDRLALSKFYGIEGVKPVWTGEKQLNARGAALLAELQRADDWGLKASDFELPASTGADATAEQLADAELRLSVAALKYARFARGGRVDPAQLSTYLDRKAQLLPAKRVIDELAASAAPDAYLRGLHPQHPQFEKLRQAYLALRDAKAPPAEAAEPIAKSKKAKSDAAPEAGSVRKLIANMEMWRWMPADLGATHLMVNVPEFQFRLVRNGQVVHSERVITGKVDTQTPIFSDMMETVVFKPTWNVPDSIKVKELLPALSRNPAALARQGLRVAYNGKEIDPTTINWATTDIRALHVFQPPSEANALGIVKFLFPNKHAVYLHDTPTKPLFNSARRAFSHGCIRVRNPVRLAELLMEADRGWSPAQVRAQLAPGAPDAADTQLQRKFPVHIAYFTAWANDAGEMQYFNDVYGYETNIHLGLEGKAHLIVKKKEEDLGAIRAASISRIVESAPAAPVNRDWMKSIFKNY